MGDHNHALFKRQCSEFFPVNLIYVKAVLCMKVTIGQNCNYLRIVL